MPLLHEGDLMPTWSELRSFRIVRGATGERVTFHGGVERRKLIVVSGRIALHEERATQEIEAGEQAAIHGGLPTTIEYVRGGTTVWVSGLWGDVTGKSGVFAVERSPEPRDIGDPASYPKETGFDRHYHDCDEFWIIVEGTGTAVSEGCHMRVGPGDCVATRMGDHHDFPLVDEAVSAVFLETTLRGRKRRGHLWEHTHGPASPIGAGR